MKCLEPCSITHIKSLSQILTLVSTQEFLLDALSFPQMVTQPLFFQGHHVSSVTCGQLRMTSSPGLHDWKLEARLANEPIPKSIVGIISKETLSPRPQGPLSLKFSHLLCYIMEKANPSPRTKKSKGAALWKPVSSWIQLYWKPIPHLELLGNLKP